MKNEEKEHWRKYEKERKIYLSHVHYKYFFGVEPASLHKRTHSMVNKSVSVTQLAWCYVALFYSVNHIIQQVFLLIHTMICIYQKGNQEK